MNSFSYEIRVWLSDNTGKDGNLLIAFRTKYGK